MPLVPNGDASTDHDTPAEVDVDIFPLSPTAIYRPLPYATPLIVEVPNVEVLIVNVSGITLRVVEVTTAWTAAITTAYTAKLPVSNHVLFARFIKETNDQRCASILLSSSEFSVTPAAGATLVAPAPI